MNIDGELATLGPSSESHNSAWTATDMPPFRSYTSTSRHRSRDGRDNVLIRIRDQHRYYVGLQDPLTAIGPIAIEKIAGDEVENGDVKVPLGGHYGQPSIGKCVLMRSPVLFASLSLGQRGSWSQRSLEAISRLLSRMQLWGNNMAALRRLGLRHYAALLLPLGHLWLTIVCLNPPLSLTVIIRSLSH